MPPLHEWETFYVIVGSAAAALTGLQFVVVALLSEASWMSGGEEEMNTFGTPTVVHFSAVLLFAAICSVPHQTASSLAACLIVAGVIGVVYEISITVRAWRTPHYDPVLEDWIFHSILPAIAYFAFVGAGVWEMRDAEAGLYPIAVASLILLYVGIHNAWDTAMYISAQRRQREREHQSDDHDLSS